MPDGPLQFPLDDEARQRLKTRVRRRASGEPYGNVARHPRNRPEIQARLKEEEKRRAMPEKLMLLVVVSVFVLTIAPVGLLALVGY
ncbi:MAG: hypothetical protein AAGF13_07675 [Pseudomonadota bacterium]